jgi:hypothetical protein
MIYVEKAFLEFCCSEMAMNVTDLSIIILTRGWIRFSRGEGAFGWSRSLGGAVVLCSGSPTVTINVFFFILS